MFTVTDDTDRVATADRGLEPRQEPGWHALSMDAKGVKVAGDLTHHVHVLRVPPITSSRPIPRDQLRIAVVGYGSIGRRHYTNLRELGVRQRVIVRRAEGANRAFESPADAHVVHDDEAAIAAGLDAAIVCNPTSLHLDTAAKYLAAGVPVLIEKPLCALGQEALAARLVERFKASGVAAGIAYCLRYHPAYRLARDLVAGGELGELRHARAWFETFLPNWHPWEDYHDSYAARAELGGGVLPTLDHEIDFLHWCLGEPDQAEVATSQAGLLGINVPDTAYIAQRYAAGSSGRSPTGSISLSFARLEHARGFEFIGSRGAVRFDWSTGRLQGCSGAAEGQDLWSDPAFDVNRMYADLLDDFLHAVAKGQPAPIPVSAGLAAARLCSTRQRELLPAAA